MVNCELQRNHRNALLEKEELTEKKNKIKREIRKRKKKLRKIPERWLGNTRKKSFGCLHLAHYDAF
jgi:uncharacterized protein YeeX (DUF496 family)